MPANGRRDLIRRLKVKLQGLSLAWAPCKALGGALLKYSILYLIFIRNFVFFFYNEFPKILPASEPTKPGFALGVNEILVTLRRGFS